MINEPYAKSGEVVVKVGEAGGGGGIGVVAKSLSLITKLD